MSGIQPYVDQIRSIIDPQNKLPEVRLVRNTLTDMGRLKGYRVEDLSGVIGCASILVDAIKMSQNFTNIRVNEKGRHLGTSAYVTAIGTALDEGFSFISDSNGLSDGSTAIWHRMVKAGLAEMLSPDVDGSNPFISQNRGEYRITPQTVSNAITYECSSVAAA